MNPLKSLLNSGKKRYFNSSRLNRCLILNICLTQEVEFPTKCISTTRTLSINASVQYIDFEGRSDGESIRKLVESVKPKRVIIVRGTPDDCKALQSFCLAGGEFNSVLIIMK